MRQLLLLFFALNVQAHAFGQQSDTVWYNKKWEKTDRANKHYYRVIQQDSVNGGEFLVQDFYPTGQLQMRGNYVSLNPEKRNGDFMWWFQDGNIQREAIYKNDTIVKITDWDENGDIIRQQEYRRTVTYQDGEAIYDIKSIDLAPEYPGGNDEMNAFISKNIQFPIEAAKNGIKGKVVAKFVIDRKGKVKNLEIIQSVHELLDQEALRVIRLMPKWTPGEQNGKKVNVMFSLPINFN